MSTVESGWYLEKNDQWPGYSVGLKIEKVLFEGKSEFQEILVFKSTTFGNVLVLDGCIQCTERDEHCYQEMISHLPINCHPDPKQVLVVGGGDGGVVREVLKYPGIERVTLCEIDQKVIEVCKEYLPSMAGSLSDPRCHVNIGDGIQYMKEHKDSFDIIITDAPDPIGAAKGLYELDYYRCLKAALKPNGIICSQGENLWLDLHVADQLLSSCRSLFPSIGYAFAGIPTYASGQIGFVMASSRPGLDFTKPLRMLSDDELDKMDMKFYNSSIHTASFVLPQFAKKVLFPASNGNSETQKNFQADV
ncbi:spermidine synthase-like [Dreissena polymorpha]|uniref:spermidine synthase-like n=1 Tax=Dreissena polymorpha TaxID=45954 RepID=UPI002264F8C4|nr:spermidine synthase-like [Dreissena polymorpha]XP_052222278.1 spermidine synthase-like [Dreissena polymorpha]